MAPTVTAYTAATSVYTKDAAVADNTPTASGGAVVSWSVSPPLPAGLSLSASTGVLTGTPTVLAPEATYVVTATNSGGTDTFTLTITVNAGEQHCPPPTSLPLYLPPTTSLSLM